MAIVLSIVLAGFMPRIDTGVPPSWCGCGDTWAGGYCYHDGQRIFQQIAPRERCPSRSKP